MNTSHVQLFIDKMKHENQPQAAIDVFLRYYDALWHGLSGYIAEDDIIPVAAGELDDFSQMANNDSDNANECGRSVLPKTVVIKLNGGLGTSMGLNTAKSLIPVKKNLSFLDITALQIRGFNRRFGVSMPLIMMNSYKTERDSLKVLDNYKDIITDIPNSFIQHKFPKVLANNLTPVKCPYDPQLEWNPPGHGDLYAAISTSGILDLLLDKGYKYAFISNIDNLGAVLDTRILGYFASKNIPFLMEVTDRTFMDRKGGHIARLKNGKLILREAAQCPKMCMDNFMNTDLHRYFNTNNLWIRLDALKEIWNNGALELPMICNRRKLDAEDDGSPDIIQLESAMGSVLSVFENADALRVPRTRFAPVKNCEELLLLWSDYYELTADHRVVMNPKHKSIQIDINLDPRFYKTLSQLEDRFQKGAPSLAGCESLNIAGDVRFGKNVIVKGNTAIINTTGAQVCIDDGAELTGEIRF